jgi:S-formylglutathione hydrolase FrmB
MRGVALRESTTELAPPWRSALRGRLDELVVESELLADNPLGDSAVRPLTVYVPPQLTDDAAPVPSVYVLQGYTGRLDLWANRNPFEINYFDRLDAMFAAGDCPPAIVVFVDAWTRYGGSQFLNSTSTGRYQDYLCDEVVPFVDARYPTLAGAAHRGVSGKSSGGYGAMVVSMQRPDVFGALASHAGDSLFEVSMVRSFAPAARLLRDRYDGSYEAFLAALPDVDPFRFEVHGSLLEMYAYAACYSPDPERPGQALLPFDLATGELVPSVWEQWLRCDPVRMVPGHLDALRGTRRIYLDAGRSDEYFLDLGAQAVSRELTRGGIEHTLDLFEGRHGGITYRYPGAIRELVLALAA